MVIGVHLLSQLGPITFNFKVQFATMEGKLPYRANY